jgi:hypothetical protein
MYITAVHWQSFNCMVGCSEYSPQNAQESIRTRGYYYIIENDKICFKAQMSPCTLGKEHSLFLVIELANIMFSFEYIVSIELRWKVKCTWVKFFKV